MKLKLAAVLALSTLASVANAEKSSLVYSENRIEHHNPLAREYPIAIGTYMFTGVLPDSPNFGLVGPSVDFNIGEMLEIGGLFGVNFRHAGGADVTNLNFLAGPTFVLPVSKTIDLRFGAKIGFMIANNNDFGFQLRTNPIAVGLKLDRLEFIAGTAFDYVHLSGDDQIGFRLLGGDFQVRYRF